MRRSVRVSDGVYLAVVEFGGGGTPILLLHGLMGRATTWWPVARRLTGHGRSQASGPWTTARMAADAAEVLDRLDAGPALVVGHSMGGLTGIELAARRPDLVRALVVEDAAADLTCSPASAVTDARAWFAAIPQPFESLAAVREAFGSERPEFGEYMAECVEERADGFHLLCRVDNAVEIAAEWTRRAYWQALAAIRCPTLLVEAEKGIVPAGQGERMELVLLHGGRVVVEGTGHLVHAAAPDTFHSLLTTALGA